MKQDTGVRTCREPIAFKHRSRSPDGDTVDRYLARSNHYRRLCRGVSEKGTEAEDVNCGELECHPEHAIRVTISRLDSSLALQSGSKHSSYNSTPNSQNGKTEAGISPGLEADEGLIIPERESAS